MLEFFRNTLLGKQLKTWDDLLEEVRRASITSQGMFHESPIHGDRHWRSVADAGLRICEHREEASPQLCMAFAMIHDSQRLDDDFDPEHGARAADFARRSKALKNMLSSEEIEELVYACAFHEKGMVSDNPRIGACWDADRLNLWRVDIPPRESFFSLIKGNMFLSLKGDFEWDWRDPPEWADLLTKMENIRTCKSARLEEENGPS